MLYMRVRGYIESVRERASARGVLKKKNPQSFLHVIYNSHIFFPGFGEGKKAREKMKSRFLIPYRRNVILFNI